MEATGSVAQIHCHNAPKFVIPRSEATWESRGIMVDNRKAIGENATACTRLPRPLWGLAMTNLKVCTLDEDAGQPATAKGAQGAPLQTQLVCTVLSAACTNCNCLHEIATSATPPRNDKPLVFTVLTIACPGRQRCAGPGCPLPYSAHRWLPAKRAASGSRAPAVRFLLESLTSRRSSR